MPGHTDILDEKESLAKPFVASIALHASVGLLLIFFTIYEQHNKVVWGFQNAGGGPGSVAISATKSLPLPQRSGHVNPLASDTESRLPPMPKQQPQARPKPPEPDAIPLRSRLRDRPLREDTAPTRYRPDRIERPNQIYSHDAPALVSNMIAKTGSGEIGVGPNGPLGTECGAYATQIQQLVASKWRTNEIDARIQTAPPAIFSFNLHRDGTIDSLARKQTSGNYQIDTTAQRALAESAPFPPISCGSNGGIIEFWFQLKR
jgi:outer membrane biosynthesis protein TonB